MNQKAFDRIDELDNVYFNNLRDQLVPACGKAATVAGEIIRAMDRLIYRYWNDGDMVGVGYGNETCNGSYRYMYSTLPNCPDLFAAAHDEDDYVQKLANLAEAVKAYIENNPSLLTEENTADSRSDYDDIQDRQWDREEEFYDDEDEYSCGW